MSRYVRSKGGRFAGSVGSGKNAVPTVSDVPAAEPGQPAEASAYSALARYPNRDVHGVTLASAQQDPVGAGRAVMASWQASSEDPQAWSMRSGVGNAVAYQSVTNPEITVISHGHDGYVARIGRGRPSVTLRMAGDGTVLTSWSKQDDSNYVRQHFNDSGLLSSREGEPAVTEVRRGRPVSYAFYADGDLLGRQIGEQLFDKRGKGLPDGLLGAFSRRRATGGLGIQPG